MLSGTATAAGTASFTVDVIDSAGATLSQNYTLTVNPALAIAPAALAEATAGTATSQTITVSDGTTPYTTFNVSGFSAGTTGLTAGDLTADAAAGTVTLSATPSAAGTASFTVDVTDTAGATLSKSYTLTVNPALSIAPAALADATAGTATSQTITVSDGSKPYTTFSISGFSAGTTGLTAGDLTTDAAAGTVTLTGTPTASGTASFTVDVIDSAGATLSQSYTLTVNPALAITPAALAEATAGTATSQTITVSDGSKPYTTFSISGFSAGTTGLTAADLTTDAAAGTVTLSGTPTAAGTASFTVDVTDTAGATLSKTYTLTVNPALTHRPGGASRCHRRDGDQPDHHGVRRQQALHHLQCVGLQRRRYGADGGGPHTDAAAGTVTLIGTPTAAGTASFTVDVIDTAGATLSQSYTLTVNPALAIAPAALADTIAGTATSADHHGVGRHQALHDVQHLRVQCRDQWADGGGPHHGRHGGNGGALRHAHGSRHGGLHRGRHR